MTSYTLTELTEQLDIPQSTLRRWCKSLEDAGYIFERVQQRRLYRDEELSVFKIMKAVMSSGTGITLDELCHRLNVKSLVVQEGNDELLQASIKSFEQELTQLTEQIYWKGSEEAVRQLQLAYEEVKKEIERQGKGE